jgi:hypothetical protein
MVLFDFILLSKMSSCAISGSSFCDNWIAENWVTGSSVALARVIAYFSKYSINSLSFTAIKSSRRIMKNMLHAREL